MVETSSAEILRGSAGADRDPLPSAMIALSALASILLSACDQNTSAPPYPRSETILDMVMDWSTLRQEAPGSDLWPITWGDDGHQYVSWGDGGGFGGTNREGRVNIGVARIEGNWDRPSFKNIWGGRNAENPNHWAGTTTSAIGKSVGIISIDDRLYMWINGIERYAYEECWISESLDGGASWSKRAWGFTNSDLLAVPTFIQFGRGYRNARDSYVYTYFKYMRNPDEKWAGRTPEARIPPDGRLVLARVHRDSVMDRDAYQWFAGKDEEGAPLWSSNIADKRSVFEEPAGIRAVAVAFNQGLGRYILTNTHYDLGSNLGVFEAPEPWGPWSTVKYWNDNGSGNRFAPDDMVGGHLIHSLSNKWTSADGREFSMIFSDWDDWTHVRGRFITNDTVSTPNQ